MLSLTGVGFALFSLWCFDCLLLVVVWVLFAYVCLMSCFRVVVVVSFGMV